MELAPKTRGNSDPRGKAKVFFSCHPADFERALPLISDDVLAHANCAFWYDPALGGDGSLPQEDEAELLDAIDDMQLVVFAVTSRFLREANRAKDLVLPHALSRHIPMLPIMLEPGLEFEFNEACAPVQVVNRYVDDPTATPYDDVLETFLSSVLVGDELAAKVRDAFDAYVFLSYRKKDRRHAQRLMHIIHDNEQFRDIAIWYDEYLVPGEGFNEAIRDAFQKSSLFALAVTPNLLEPENYVMDVEFPLARDRRRDVHNMEIVPVEMYDMYRDEARTDRMELADKYRDIPEVQDEHIRPELDEAFIDALARVGTKEKDGSPQHRFFIGLAYLNGIDVEPNYARALDLITQAATDEDPCIDATDKLVDMYLVGDGVARDLDMAVSWQRKAVRQRRDEYERGHDPDEHRGRGTAYFRALMRLSDLLRETGDVEGAVRMAEQALAFADELVEEVGVREMDRDTAVILNRLGSLHRLRGDYAGAEACYSRALETYERLAAAIGTTRARRDLSIGYERLGDMRRRNRDLDDAGELYGKALAIREGLAAGSTRPRARRDLSVALTKRGNVCKDGKDWKGALEYYSRALDIDYELSCELMTPQATDDYCVSLVKLGDVLKKTGDATGAVARFDAAREDYESLIAKMGSLRYRKNHARCLGKLASALKYAGRGDEAERRFRDAITAWEGIRRDEKTPSDGTAHELAAAHLNYALFKRNREEALKAIEIWQQLAVRNPRYARYLETAKKRFGYQL